MTFNRAKIQSLCLLIALAMSQPAAAVSVTQFPVSGETGGNSFITVGPDGALWFTELTDNIVGRIAIPGVTPSVGHANRVHRIPGTRKANLLHLRARDRLAALLR